MAKMPGMQIVSETVLAGVDNSGWLGSLQGLDDGAGIAVPIPGERLPLNPQYRKLAMKRAFFQASFDGGAEYVDARDSNGQPVLIRHEPKETDAGFARRKRMATFKNFCKPIVRSFNDFVFRQPVKRDGANADFTAWAQNVDLLGTPIGVFMKRLLRTAAIQGCAYVGIDSTRPPGTEAMTAEQAREAGAVPFLQAIDACRLINWRRQGGALVEALVVYGAGDRAVLWRHQTKTDFVIDTKTGLVVSVNETVHGWPIMPILEVAPFEQGESQIVDIAELNKAVFNMDSLLREEIYGCTFSQYWVIGANPEQLADAAFGPNRVLTLPNPDAKVQVTGGSPEQAESIRRTIEGDIAEIYRLAGLRAEDPMKTSPAKSGVALMVEFDRIDATMAAIADEAERIENLIGLLWSIAMDSPVGPVDYPDAFGTPDVAAEIGRALDVLSQPYSTPTSKLLESRRLNGVLHPKASPADRAAMDAESGELFGPEADEAASGKGE